MATKCNICGLTYVPELSEDRREHRRRHSEYMSVFSPRPSKRFQKWIDTSADPEHVGHASARWKHYEVYKRAVRFKREFGYDFIQWAPHGTDNVSDHAFLFNDDTGTFGYGAIVGACAFIWKDDASPPGMTMSWVWITPEARRKGVLTRRWPIFRKRFGPFYLERPLSPAMSAFLENPAQTEKP